MSSNEALLLERYQLAYAEYRAEVLLGSERLAKQLGTGDDWQTTGGMREHRGEPRWRDWLKVNTAIQSLLGLYVLFDVLAVFLLA